MKKKVFIFTAVLLFAMSLSAHAQFGRLLDRANQALNTVDRTANTIDRTVDTVDRTKQTADDLQQLQRDQRFVGTWRPAGQNPNTQSAFTQLLIVNNDGTIRIFLGGAEPKWVNLIWSSNSNMLYTGEDADNLSPYATLSGASLITFENPPATLTQ
jgi:hypothetical protein